MINAMNDANVIRRTGQAFCCMHSRDGRLEFFLVLRAGYDRAR